MNILSLYYKNYFILISKYYTIELVVFLVNNYNAQNSNFESLYNLSFDSIDNLLYWVNTTEPFTGIEPEILKAFS
jgi:hypothetical protein